jgi:hypothetical protein
MAVATGRNLMARPKGRPKTSERNDAVARVDAVIVSKAKMVASARGITLAEYLSDLLRMAVDRDFVREMERLQPEGGGSKAKPPK